MILESLQPASVDMYIAFLFTIQSTIRNTIIEKDMSANNPRLIPVLPTIIESVLTRISKHRMICL